MKKTLLSSLVMLLLVACGGSDSTTVPTTTTVPDVLNTAPHFETGGTWTDGPSVSGISWRRIDMGFYGALRISYNMTFTNNDPSRAVGIGFTIHFKDATGFELAEKDGDWLSISAESSKEIGGMVNLEGVTTVSLANQISKMELRAGFMF